MFGWMGRWLTQPAPLNGQRVLSDDAPLPRRARIVRAKYDAAQTTDDNTRHWTNADSLSADAANSSSVRKYLRNRARYEVANNSYAKGIVLTLANDTIGTGPRLQVLLGNKADKATGGGVNSEVEARWAEWSERIKLADKLRTARMAKASDGEAFILFVGGEEDSKSDVVTLDLRLIEGDQVSTPYYNILDPLAIDGIRTDRFGNPTSYDILRYHPGDSAFAWTDNYDSIAASEVIHLFRADRPGQHRGIPEITAALELFAQLRRYTEATIAAAETAADFAAVIYSDMPSSTDVNVVAPLDTIEIEKRMMTTMPYGYKLEQFRAEHPSTTYGEFKNHILNEIARCLNMPFNVAACNSSDYNYASGRLDHQLYFKSIRVEQRYLETTCLNRIFAAWYAEARLVYGWPDVSVPHEWFWDGYEHVDPESEANAAMIRLASGLTTHPSEYAREGRDWEDQMTQAARALGVSLDEYQALVRIKVFGEPKELPAPAANPRTRNGDASGTRNENGKTRPVPSTVVRR